MITPIFKQLQEELTDVTFETVDIDATPEMATMYKVRSVPTVIIFKDGSDVVSLTGAASKRQYLDLIEEAKNA
jgi:thioredoxin 1